MSKQLDPLTGEQQIFLEEVGKIREILETEGVSEECEDAVFGCLYTMFIQDDRTTHMMLSLSMRLMDLLPEEEFRKLLQEAAKEAQGATDEDIDKINDCTAEIEGYMPDIGGMS